MPWNHGDYQKALLLSKDDSVSDETKQKLASKISEYQGQHPESAALDTRSPQDSAPTDWTQVPGESAPEAPAAPLTVQDPKLRSASKLPELYAEPEYHPPQPANPIAAFRASVPSTFGGTVQHFYEPGWQTFQREMGPILAMKGIDVSGTGPSDTLHYSPSTEWFNKYRDMKWAAARKQAEAQGIPIVRHEYADRQGVLTKVGDAANTAVQEGVFPGVEAAADTAFVVPGVGKLLRAGADQVAPGFYESSREGIERNPVTAELAGIAGMANPGSFASRSMKALNDALGVTTRGVLGRLAGTGLSSAVTNVAQGAADDAADVAASAATGATPNEHEPLDDAASRAVAGATLGAGSELLGSGAAGARKAFRSGERGRMINKSGGSLSFTHGFEPNPAVKPFLLEGGPEVATAHAAEPATEKIAQGAATVDSEIRARQGRQNTAALASPDAQEMFEPKNTANTLFAELQGARGPHGETLPWVNDPANREVINKIFEPTLVPAERAAQTAGEVGGNVLSVEDAQRLGIDLSGARKSTTAARNTPQPDQDLAATNMDFTPPQTTSVPGGSASPSASGDLSGMKVILRPRLHNTPNWETVIDALGARTQSAAKVQAPEQKALARLHASALSDRPNFPTLQWDAETPPEDKFYKPSQGFAELKKSQQQELSDLERDLGHANVRRADAHSQIPGYQDMTADQQKAVTGSVSKYEDATAPLAMNKALERFAKAGGGLEDLKRVAQTKFGAKLAATSSPLGALHASVGEGGAFGRVSSGIVNPLMFRLDSPLNALGTPAFEPAPTLEQLGVTPKLALFLKSLRTEPVPVTNPVRGAFAAKGGYLGQRAAATLTKEDLKNLQMLLTRFGDKLGGKKEEPQGANP